MELLRSLGIEPENPGIYFGGEIFKSNSIDQRQLTSISPVDESHLARVNVATFEDYDVLIKKAHHAFLSWREVPAPKRGELIRQIGDALREHKDHLGSLISYEMGKTKQEGDGEVQEMIDMADFAVGQSRMLYGNTMHSERRHHRLYEQWHPLGVVGVISSFNFPVAVWAWNAFLSAICGNVTIWKPSSKTPLCAIAVQKICDQVLKNQGYLGIFSLFISNEHSLTEHFIRDVRLPLISFTGSCVVGRRVSALVAQRLGRSLLELGGNNAIIVDESANLDLAIPAIVFGAVGTAGQRCTSTRRLIVHEGRYPEIIERLQQTYRQIRIGNPLDPHFLMGPLVDEKAKKDFLAAITEIKAAGGEVLFGGHAIDKPGFYVQPTLIKAQNHWPIVQRETFAPILYVMTYREFDEAIALQNAAPQGLSSALFTERFQQAEHFLSVIGSDCGIANVNVGTSGAEIGGAFGGEKETGGGREAGSDAWKAYMRRQTNTLNWGKDLLLAQGIQFQTL